MDGIKVRAMGEIPTPQKNNNKYLEGKLTILDGSVNCDSSPPKPTIRAKFYLCIYNENCVKIVSVHLKQRTRRNNNSSTLLQ